MRRLRSQQKDLNDPTEKGFYRRYPLGYKRGDNAIKVTKRRDGLQGDYWDAVGEGLEVAGIEPASGASYLGSPAQARRRDRRLL